MKLKLKISTLFKYAYILLIMGNIVALFFLYQFVNAYVVKMIYFDDAEFSNRTLTSGNIDVKKFNEVLDSYNKKTQTQKNIRVNNIFN